MKNLLCALVFLFPCAVGAQGVEDLPSEERLRVLRNCCATFHPKSETSIIGELKPQDPVKRLLRKRKLQLYAVNPDKPEDGRLSFERHQKIYGFWYRQESGILNDPRSLDSIARWFSSPDDP